MPPTALVVLITSLLLAPHLWRPPSAPAAQPEAAGITADSQAGPVHKAPMSRDDQEKRAMALFSTIHDLAQGPDRTANLGRMTDLYQEIIDQCPDVPLAQESYWRLIEMDLRDYQPPRVAAALARRAQLRSRYPASPVLPAAEISMARALYLNGSWAELLQLSATATASPDRIDSKSPLWLFYRAESQSQLGDLTAARQGFQTLIDRYPDGQLAGRARQRLAELPGTGAAAP
ncbi:MAG: tetratricopeptide repeat protein [Thermodesulfobacteriota bacterium]